MALFPHSRDLWMRSIARPLLYSCTAVLLFVLISLSLGEGRFWRYYAGPVAVFLMPAGVVLAITCWIGKSLGQDFRAMGWIVAFISVFFGLLIIPNTH